MDCCRQPPFLLVGIGLAVWCASAFVAGLAQAANSYTLLFLGRMLSGVGEASFQVDCQMKKCSYQGGREYLHVIFLVILCFPFFIFASPLWMNNTLSCVSYFVSI